MSSLPEHTIDRMYALSFVPAEPPDKADVFTITDSNGVVYPFRTEVALRAFLDGVYLGRNQVARVVLNATTSDDSRNQLAEGLRGRFGKGIE